MQFPGVTILALAAPLPGHQAPHHLQIIPSFYLSVLPKSLGLANTSQKSQEPVGKGPLAWLMPL